jgi:Na+/melibiose symporter-like transporter
LLAKEPYRLRDIGKVLVKNRMLTILAVAMFLNTCVWVVKNAVAAYYFKYVLGNEAFMATFFLFMLVANLAGALLTPWLTKRFGKREVFMLGSVVILLLYGGRFWVAGGALTIFVVVSMIGSAGEMMCSITQWGMLPDTVEYGHWATGVRSEGIPFAFFSFMQKLGMAVAGAVAAYALDWVGYVPNKEQTSTALLGINSLFNLVPATFSLVCLITLFFYRLDGKLYPRILRELAERQAGNGQLPEAGEELALEKT